MCPTEKRYRVNRKDLAYGAKIEQQEHGMSARTSRKLARQQLQEHPNFYRLKTVTDAVLTRSERGIKPIRRH